MLGDGNMISRTLLGAIVLGALMAGPALAQETASAHDPAPPAAQPAALIEANGLEQQAGALFQKGDYPGALPLLERAYALRKESAGEQDPDTLHALSNLVAITAEAGRPADAEPLAARLVEQSRAVIGPRDPATLRAMALHSNVLVRLGRMAEAAPIMEETLKLRREISGERDPETISALNNYGYLLVSIGKYAEAAPIMADVLRLRREVLGPGHPDTLSSLSNNAVVLLKLGRAAEGAPLMAEVVRQTEQALGERHPQTILALNNQAAFLLQAGDFPSALALLDKVVTLDREVLGENHPQTLQALNNQAGILLKLGRLTEAEPLMARALELRRAVLGAAHPDTMETLNNEGYLLNALGRADEAGKVLAEALRVRRETLGPRHPDTVQSLLNYAAFLRVQSRDKEAIPLIEEAYRLRLETLGENHPETLAAMNGYAIAVLGKGDKATAGPMLAKLVDLRRELQGPKHPDTIEAIDTYGGFFAATERPAKAEPLIAEAEALSRTVLGDSHPATIGRIEEHAAVLSELGRQSEAEALYAEAARLAGTSPALRTAQRTATAGLAMTRLSTSGREALAFEPAQDLVAQAGSDDEPGEDVALSSQAARDHDRAEKFVLYADAAWARTHTGASGAGLAPLDAAEEQRIKGASFVALQNAMINVTSRALARTAALRAATRVGLGAEARERDALLGSRRALDAALVRSYAASGAEADVQRQGIGHDLEAIGTRLAAVEETLRARAPDYFALIRPRPLSLAEARALLGPKEAMLQIVTTRGGTQVMLLTREGLSWHRSKLGRDALDPLVRRLLWDVGANVDISGVEEAQWSNEGEGATPYDFRTAYKLYQELIEPIAPALAGKTQLFVASAGVMSSLPLGILVSEVPKGADGDPAVLRSAKWLGDSVAISVIPSIQSLEFIRKFRPAGERGGVQGSYLGFGDPVLDGVSVERGGGGARRRGGIGVPALGSVFAGDTDRGGALASPTELRKLARLPATRVEIENQWRAFGQPANATFLGAAATEAQVKHATLSARVIAFATHGLLAGELKGSSEPGLVLTPPASPSSEDDGFLSASEISALKVDAGWVLLSACNTAAGDGSSGAPGLSGLARAFFFAGATNLLVSHWPVRDDVASRLTVRAIAIARETPGLTRAEAVQRAAREIRNDASHDTAQDSWAHPSAWAPFSLVGDGAR